MATTHQCPGPHNEPDRNHPRCPRDESPSLVSPGHSEGALTSVGSRLCRAHDRHSEATYASILRNSLAPFVPLKWAPRSVAPRATPQGQRLVQKKPPPPSNRTRSTMIMMVPVDIYANPAPCVDPLLLGVRPVNGWKAPTITRSKASRLNVLR